MSSLFITYTVRYRIDGATKVKTLEVQAVGKLSLTVAKRCAGEASGAGRYAIEIVSIKEKR